MIRRERRDGGESRGNEEREKREREQREDRHREKRERDIERKRKRHKRIEMTFSRGGGKSPLASACCSASSRHCGTPPKT